MPSMAAEERENVQISQFFMRGDMRGAMAYMREYEEFMEEKYGKQQAESNG